MIAYYKKKQELEHRCLVNDDFFRYVVSVCPRLLIVLAVAFLGEEWADAKAESQGDIAYGKNYITVDGLLEAAHKIAMLEMNRSFSFPNVVGVHHQRLCAARISGRAIGNEVIKIVCLVLSDYENAVGGRPSLILKWEGYDGEQCPEFILAIYDVKMAQGNELLDDICHDLHCESLRDMRNQDIIDAIKKARPDCEGDVMEQLYNEFTMKIYNQGREEAVEETRLDCCAKAIERNMANVSEAAETFGVDETKLVNYIKTCKGNNPN